MNYKYISESFNYFLNFFTNKTEAKITDFNYIYYA